MRLAREIAKHNQLYHAQDAPEVSDAQYDALVRRNAELEAAFPHLIRDDSPSKLVGHEVTTSPLSKVTHAVRMMSLDNAFTDAEVEEFVRTVFYLVVNLRLVAPQLLNIRSDQKLLPVIEVLQIEVKNPFREVVIDFLRLVMGRRKAL